MIRSHHVLCIFKGQANRVDGWIGFWVRGVKYDFRVFGLSTGMDCVMWGRLQVERQGREGQSSVLDMPLGCPAGAAI